MCVCESLGFFILRKIHESDRAAAADGRPRRGGTVQITTVYPVFGIFLSRIFSRERFVSFSQKNIFASPRRLIEFPNIIRKFFHDHPDGHGISFRNVSTIIFGTRRSDVLETFSKIYNSYRRYKTDFA